jgi:FkbM family methyltransferase
MSFLQKKIRTFGKLLVRATEMSRLHYSSAEIASIVSAIALAGKRHYARMLGYRVKYLHPPSFRLAAFEVFVRGEYLFDASHPSPVILDCGANIGLATLFFKRLYPAARIHSFEADPTTSEVLRCNVEQNHLREVTVSNLLLSDHAGDEKFYVVSGAPGSLSMSASQSRVASRRNEITVQAGRLSDYVDGPVDLLKLDVEGSEFAVMRDLVASGKIGQISKMFIEYHHKIENEPSRLSSFLALLEEAGFEYQIQSAMNVMAKGGQFQDVLISAFRE